MYFFFGNHENWYPASTFTVTDVYLENIAVVVIKIHHNYSLYDAMDLFTIIFNNT